MNVVWRPEGGVANGRQELNGWPGKIKKCGIRLLPKPHKRADR
jgi:hypothetical protein